MSSQVHKGVFGSVTFLVIGLAGCVFLGQLCGCSNKTAEAESGVTVLCGKCGYSGECSLAKLVPPAGGQAARSPVYGPGYKCPKCGQETLYTRPMKCSGCGTLYLSSKDASGAIVSKCPKCGKEQ